MDKSGLGVAHPMSKWASPPPPSILLANCVLLHDRNSPAINAFWRAPHSTLVLDQFEAHFPAYSACCCNSQNLFFPSQGQAHLSPLTYPIDLVLLLPPIAPPPLAV